MTRPHRSSRARSDSRSHTSRRLLNIDSSIAGLRGFPSSSRFSRLRSPAAGTARTFTTYRPARIMNHVRAAGNWSPWAWLSGLRSMPLRYLAVPLIVWCVVSVVLFSANQLDTQGRLHIGKPQGPGNPMHEAKPHRPMAPRISCYGPRGRLLSESPDDELEYATLKNISYPTPFFGSHRELGIDKTWMTAEGRYGPYGFGEDNATYTRSKPDWDALDWGQLQDDCFQRNAGRFPYMAPSSQVGEAKRFTLREHSSYATTPQLQSLYDTRRTVLVMRSYEGFNYTSDQMWSIRSIITEASLRTGGEYAVVIMINVKNKGLETFQSQENYDRAFEMLNIPPELRSITVLWDDQLLQSWYPKVSDHSTRWQVNQPLQLFALHHPEFDHYWQIEMDQRFLGDVGKYLDAVAEFARYEPRKQALERSTYPFNEDVYGTYANMTKEVDKRNEGQSRAWGPVYVAEVDPKGPSPPVARSEDDDFRWGVGEDADIVTTSFCADVLETSWEYVGYIEGFQHGIFTPRWWCPPAIMRNSRALLLTVHDAQADAGLSMPSEAILPSFALYHGLKLSYPPQPAYMHVFDPDNTDVEDETSRDPAQWRYPDRKPWFGNTPSYSRDGTSRADPRVRADRGLTWWWTSNYPRKIMDVWLNGRVDDEKMPNVCAVHEGKVYVPNMVLHPVKASDEFR